MVDVKSAFPHTPVCSLEPTAGGLLVHLREVGPKDSWISLLITMEQLRESMLDCEETKNPELRGATKRQVACRFEFPTPLPVDLPPLPPLDDLPTL